MEVQLPDEQCRTICSLGMQRVNSVKQTDTMVDIWLVPRWRSLPSRAEIQWLGQMRHYCYCCCAPMVARLPWQAG